MNVIKNLLKGLWEFENFMFKNPIFFEILASFFLLWLKYHISDFFDFLEENASSRYSQFKKKDYSWEKSSVYKEVMQIFEYVDFLKSGQKIGNEEQLIIQLNQIHKKNQEWLK